MEEKHRKAAENLAPVGPLCEKKGNPLALLPIAVFLLIYIGVSIIFKDFYLMSVVVAFLAALLVACVQNRALSLDDKLGVMARGVADKNIITMILIFLAAGIFAGILGREGAAAVADLLLNFIPARFSVIVIFVVACFVSTAMGTSVGTITVIAPIGAAVAAATGISPVLFVASVVGGAMFGDNLSFISDTTIAATSTQGCQMRDKFRENFIIALPAALLTVGILLIMALAGGEVSAYEPQSINLWLLLPYFLVLIGGILGINVFLVLLGGIVVASVVKLSLGAGVASIISAMGGGASGMFEVIIVTLLVSMLSALMREHGGFDALLSGIKRVFRGRVGGQLGISALVSAMDVATANNTVAIVMAAPIAKSISEEYGITNTKTASLLDIFGSVVQGLIPYGAQLLIATQLTGISAAQMMPFMFYQYLLAISAVVFMFLPSFKQGRKKA